MLIVILGSDLDFFVAIVELIKTTHQLLNEIKRVLDRSNRFNHFEVVGNARIPIIKCVHIATGFKCDINVTNNVGVYNSKIMSYLMKFDKRITNLAVIIKFWMKVHNLIGPKFITSYCTMWLLFFYLQQLSTPILPPIREFQRGIAPFFIGTANLAFKYNRPNLIRNNDRIATLLIGFFEFYDKFDFLSQFISPHHGQAFPRRNFQQKFPRHFQLYREILNTFPNARPMEFRKPICIQDPFDICDTKPGRVTYEYFNRFKYVIAHTARVCREKLMATGESKELLLTLFDDIPLPKYTVVDTFINNENILEKMISTDISTGGKSFQIIAMDCEMKCAHRRLYRGKEQDNWESSEIEQLWARLCTNYLVKVLKFIFGFEFSIDYQTITLDLNEKFDISAVMDVFHKCKPMKVDESDLKLLLERTKNLLKRRNRDRTGRVFDKPLVIKTLIRADVKNSRAIWIDFHYEKEDKKIQQFFDHFTWRSRAIILAYFNFEIHSFLPKEGQSKLKAVTLKETAPEELKPVQRAELSLLDGKSSKRSDAEISNKFLQLDELLVPKMPNMKTQKSFDNEVHHNGVRSPTRNSE